MTADNELTPAAIIEILGLTRDQFTQVVLLPQGEFARFLRASDDERREDRHGEIFHCLLTFEGVLTES